ncbi:MAG: ribosome silencing factor [Flavobacteriales bacterium]|nr:ribosome silencing factor [Flavobacteriales bacterium]
MTKKTGNPQSTALLDAIVAGIQEVKGEDIVVLDLRSIENSAADYFVICSGSSTTQVEAIARSVEAFTEKKLGEGPFRTEGTRNATWVLQDFADVVVHIFHKDTRAFYQLEELWADADIRMIENRA